MAPEVKNWAWCNSREKFAQFQYWDGFCIQCWNWDGSKMLSNINIFELMPIFTRLILNCHYKFVLKLSSTCEVHTHTLTMLTQGFSFAFNAIRLHSITLSHIQLHSLTFSWIQLMLNSTQWSSHALNHVQLHSVAFSLCSTTFRGTHMNSMP